jgi:hypothetical protein
MLEVTRYFSALDSSLKLDQFSSSILGHIQRILLSPAIVCDISPECFIYTTKSADSASVDGTIPITNVVVDYLGSLVCCMLTAYNFNEVAFWV